MLYVLYKFVTYLLILPRDICHRRRVLDLRGSLTVVCYSGHDGSEVRSLMQFMVCKTSCWSCFTGVAVIPTSRRPECYVPHSAEVSTKCRIV
jgi:hypothetical protein